MLVAGLTGNYGMGKSTVLGMFRDLGAVVVDSDRIVDGLLENREVLGRLRQVLGDEAFHEDGRLDRRKTAELVFRDSGLRKAVEAVLHPLVFEGVETFLRETRLRLGEDTVVVVEVPLLFEADGAGQFQRIVTVFIDPALAIERLTRGGIDRDEAVRRMEAQMPIIEKIRRSDYVIDNSGSPEETRALVAEVYRRLIMDMKAGGHSGET